MVYDVLNIRLLRENNCLNPCFLGRWSMTKSNFQSIQLCVTVLILVVLVDGLWQRGSYHLEGCGSVLILVVLVDGLWRKKSFLLFIYGWRVLILVVVVDGLWRWRTPAPHFASGLNPCCRGRWSVTVARRHWRRDPRVLILVVVVDGLWRNGKEHIHPGKSS